MDPIMNGKRRKNLAVSLHRTLRQTKTRAFPSLTEGIAKKMRSLSVLVTDISKDSSLQMQQGWENKGHGVWKCSQGSLQSTRYLRKKAAPKSELTKDDVIERLVDGPRVRRRQPSKDNATVAAEKSDFAFRVRNVTCRGRKKKTEVKVIDVVGEDSVEKVKESGSESQSDAINPKSQAGEGLLRLSELVNQVDPCPVPAEKVVGERVATSRSKSVVQENSSGRRTRGSTVETGNKVIKVASIEEVPILSPSQQVVPRRKSLPESVRRSPRKTASPNVLDPGKQKVVTTRQRLRGSDPMVVTTRQRLRRSEPKIVTTRQRLRGSEPKVAPSEQSIKMIPEKKNSLDQINKIANANDGKVVRLRGKRRASKQIEDSGETAEKRLRVQKIKGTSDSSMVTDSKSTQKSPACRKTESVVADKDSNETQAVQKEEASSTDAAKASTKIPRRRSNKIRLEWCSYCGTQLDSVDNRLEHEFGHQEPRQLLVSLHRCNLNSQSVKLPVYVNLDEVAALKSPQEDSCESKVNDSRPLLNVENVLNEDEYEAYDPSPDSVDKNKNLETFTEELMDVSLEESSPVGTTAGESEINANGRRAKKKAHLKMRLWENTPPRMTRCGRLVKVTKKFEESVFTSKRSLAPASVEAVSDEVVSVPPEEAVGDYVEVVVAKETLDNVVVTGSLPVKDPDTNVSKQVSLMASEELDNDLSSETPDGVSASEVAVNKSSEMYKEHEPGDNIGAVFSQLVEDKQIVEEENPLENDENFKSVTVEGESSSFKLDFNNLENYSENVNTISEQVGGDLDQFGISVAEDVPVRMKDNSKEIELGISSRHEDDTLENEMNPKSSKEGNDVDGPGVILMEEDGEVPEALDANSNEVDNKLTLHFECSSSGEESVSLNYSEDVELDMGNTKENDAEKSDSKSGEIEDEMGECAESSDRNVIGVTDEVEGCMENLDSEVRGVRDEIEERTKTLNPESSKVADEVGECGENIDPALDEDAGVIEKSVEKLVKSTDEVGECSENSDPKLSGDADEVEECRQNSDPGPAEVVSEVVECAENSDPELSEVADEVERCSENTDPKLSEDVDEIEECQQNSDHTSTEVVDEVEECTENSDPELNEVADEVEKCSGNSDPELSEVADEVEKCSGNSDPELSEVADEVEQCNENSDPELSEVADEVEKCSENTGPKLSEDVDEIEKCQQNSDHTSTEVVNEVEECTENSNPELNEVADEVEQCSENSDPELSEMADEVEQRSENSDPKVSEDVDEIEECQQNSDNASTEVVNEVEECTENSDPKLSEDLDEIEENIELKLGEVADEVEESQENSDPIPMETANGVDESRLTEDKNSELEDISDGDFELADEEGNGNKAADGKDDGEMKFQMTSESVKDLFAENSGSKSSNVEVNKGSENEVGEVVQNGGGDGEEREADLGDDDDDDDRDTVILDLDYGERAGGFMDCGDDDVRDLSERKENEKGSECVVKVENDEEKSKLALESTEMEDEYEEAKKIKGDAYKKQDSAKDHCENLGDVHPGVETSVIGGQHEEDAGVPCSDASGVVGASDGEDDSCAENRVSECITKPVPFKDITEVKSVNSCDNGKDKLVSEHQVVRDFDDDKSVVCCQ